MKKSVWSGYFIEYGPEEMVELFEKAGYKYCELSFEHADTLIERSEDVVRTGKDFRTYAMTHGMHFTQGHLPMRLKICQNRDDLEMMKKYLDLFEGIGIRYCVVHCDKYLEVPNMTLEEVRDRNIEVFQELGEYIKDTDMVICLENLNIFPIHAENLLGMLEHLDQKHFAICFDTGHLHMNQGDVVEFVKKAGSRIKALHIADNEGSRDQHMMPCGKGGIDFVAVFKELKKTGYDGLYNLEIPGETNAPLEVKLLKLDYINKMMDVLDKLSENS